MSLQSKTSFAGGELDPALHRRVSLDKFNSGVAIGRNCIIGKTGRIVNTPGTVFKRLGKTDGEDIVIEAIPNTPYYLEFGHLYVRIHNFDTGLYSELVTVYDRTTLTNLHFSVSSNNNYTMYVHDGGLPQVISNISTTPAIANLDLYSPPFIAITLTNTANTGTGPLMEYFVTRVEADGQEDVGTGMLATPALPIVAGQRAEITIASATPAAMYNVYRRPLGGGAYGYIGSSIGGSSPVTFVDLGVNADYTHSPPVAISNIVGFPRTSVIMQQRNVFGNYSVNPEVIQASRTRHLQNFKTDIPTNDSSALSFKAGSSGIAKVLRLLDNGALVAFTSNGIYANDDAPLTPTNTAMRSKGEWVIDEKVPPLKIPGAIIFVDVSTNSVRALSYTTEGNTYSGEEISIYSNHLFQNRRIVSWSFLPGEIPVVWVIFDNGNAATLTYHREQKMLAWTPQDTIGDYKCVTTIKSDTTGKSSCLFVIKRGTKRMIEVSTPRFPSDQKELILSHSTVTKKNNRLDTPPGIGFTADNTTDLFTSLIVAHGYVTGTELFATTTGTLPAPLVINKKYYAIYVSPTTYRITDSYALALAGIYLNITTNGSGTNTFFETRNGIGLLTKNGATWDTNLNLNADINLFVVSDVGKILKIFSSTGIEIKLTITALINSRNVTVEPSETIPVDLQGNLSELWDTYTTVTGLDHLEGLAVSVLSDGAVIASPNNDIENYASLVVTGGSITLPNAGIGAITHVGLPYTSDIKTLNIDSLDGKRVLLENKLVNRVVLEVYRTRGLYVGPTLPADDKVSGMSEVEKLRYEVDPANAVLPLKTTQIDVVIDGEYSYGGSICTRQVDPLPFEILAIIPDIIV